MHTVWAEGILRKSIFESPKLNEAVNLYALPVVLYT